MARPTIEELEGIITREEEDTINILPDGTIVAVDPTSASRLKKILDSPERKAAEY